MIGEATARKLAADGLAVIAQCSGQVARRAAKGSRGERPPAFDKGIYRQRNVVERWFNRVKQWRALATRHGLAEPTPLMWNLGGAITHPMFHLSR